MLTNVTALAWLAATHSSVRIGTRLWSARAAERRRIAAKEDAISWNEDTGVAAGQGDGADPAPPGAPEQVQLLLTLLKYATLLNRPMLEGVAVPKGISLNELRVLMSLGGEGEAAGHTLALVMGMPPMNVSRALQALHAMGWIEQVPDAANKRRKPFRLSADGWAAYRAMTPEVETVADFLFSGLTGTERQRFQRTIDKLVARMPGWKSAGSPTAS